MTEEDKVRAVNANTLRQDPTFQAAVLEARRSALEELARIEPMDVEAIRNAQAKIRAIDALTTALAGFIITGTPQRMNPAV
ncbi:MULTISPECIES: hypothetical protein [unclassified Mesorhizobium]|uniref:hypothetical protein n=1 Tax=unclassified Mesorhizobium TaxID=325217 RepID=UPI000FCCC3AF|nr:MULTISPECIES: hypothetical protein [unclassified Mesorhizobium]TGP25899.1 hypothetical protein EN875_034520 [Mesorhizobium sp. M2D.F.Ca.ET.232.01.1.1]TGQ23782.1 hypothetical protein EN863_065090 [Mesorhizobium sp. M00.F.Ca.ET.220.01.1.1]TGT95830.1 hypothetical protein EN806_53955 [bacterium M00.F.Ca.ET.163.01.1.1]